MNTLEAAGLVVHRGQAEVLHVPSFALRRGGRTALVGPNGAGKTTLLLTLAGLLRPTAGVLSVDGRSVTDLPAYRRRVSMVFQQPLLFDTTVRGNIASGLRIRRLDRGEIAHRVERYAALFGLTGLLDRSARKLSVGEAQRTTLARGFAIEPEALFLDEPFVALDRPTRESILDDLQRALQDTGMALLFATHDQDEALRISDEIAVLNNGRIVQTGDTEEILNHPADAFVATFLGTETVLHGRIVAAAEGCLRVSVGGVEIEAAGDGAVGDSVTLCIRPESVTLSAPGPMGVGSSARNAFAAKVLEVARRRYFWRAELDAGCLLVSHITQKSMEEMDLKPGSSVTASFKATSVHVIKR